MEEITISIAEEKEIDVISRLASEIWPVAYAEILSEEQLFYMLGLMYSHEALLHQMQQQHTFLLLKENDVPIGFAAYTPIQEPGTFKLQKLYALPQKQKLGYGRLLLQRVINDIKNLGGTALQLNVNRKNKAISFYEKAGFIIIRKEDIPIGKGFYMNDFIMEKRFS